MGANFVFAALFTMEGTQRSMQDIRGTRVWTLPLRNSWSDGVRQTYKHAIKMQHYKGCDWGSKGSHGETLDVLRSQERLSRVNNILIGTWKMGKSEPVKEYGKEVQSTGTAKVLNKRELGTSEEERGTQAEEVDSGLLSHVKESGLYLGGSGETAEKFWAKR